MSVSTVSVVIPTHDRWPLIDRALDSVFVQTEPPYEVIVVDDASTDSTAERLAGTRDERLRVIRLTTNSGPGHARNVGIDACQGRFVAFVDSDDEWMPTYLETMAGYLHADPNVIAVCSALIHRTSVADNVFRPEWGDDAFEQLLSLRSRAWSGIVFDRDAARHVRFDTRFPAMEERDFLLALSRIGSVVCSPAPLYVAHDDAGERVSDPRNMLRARMMFIEKHRRELGQRPAALANNYYRLARLQQRMGDRRGLRDSLRNASKADPRDRRLRWLAAIARVGAIPADLGLGGMIRLSLMKEKLGSTFGRTTVQSVGDTSDG